MGAVVTWLPLVPVSERILLQESRDRKVNKPLWLQWFLVVE